jgi:quercetin dioxygenase-like cupin family protein/DNA-binding XRE family transcriptional regulator
MSQRKDGKLARGQKRGKKRPAVYGEGEDFLTASLHFKGHEVSSSGLAGKGNLGNRLRQVREMRGLTLQDLSSRTGIDTAVLQSVENNQIIPPLGELVKLGKALEMQMGYFISPGIDTDMTVVRAHSRRRVARYGEKRSERAGYYYESLAPEKANRRMEPFLVTLIPVEIDELSTHDGQEFIFILEGEVKARVGKQEEILQPGDALYFDSNRPHLITCAGGKPAKILAVLYTGAR